MKIIKTSNYKKIAKSEGPKLDILKENRISLTDEEKKEVKNKGAVWGSDGDLGVWKAKVNEKVWYVCNTHRAYQSKTTLRGAIKAFDFIKTTS